MSDMIVRTEADDYKPVMSIEDMLYQKEQLRLYVNACLIESKPGQVDGDYGTIPGAGTRKVLLLPGAQKLCRMRGLSPDYDILSEDEDWTGDKHGGEPFFNYKIKCILLREDRRMGSGVGACNSFEKKYRYVQGQRICPTCQKPHIFVSKEQGGGYFCWKTKGGCGAQFKLFSDGYKLLQAQEIGKVANPDAADLQNTILKMAKKRAYIDATLSVVGASEFFTQDVDTERPTPPQGSRSAPPADRDTYEAEYMPIEDPAASIRDMEQKAKQRPNDTDTDGVVHNLPTRPPLTPRQETLRRFREVAAAINPQFGHSQFTVEMMSKMVKAIMEDGRAWEEVSKDLSAWTDATGTLQLFKENFPEWSAETTLKAIQFKFGHKLPMTEFTAGMWESPLPPPAAGKANNAAVNAADRYMAPEEEEEII